MDKNKKGKVAFFAHNHCKSYPENDKKILNSEPSNEFFKLKTEVIKTKK